MPAAGRHGSIVFSAVQWPSGSAPGVARIKTMHDLTTTDVDTRPAHDRAPDRDLRHEMRMAWIASLWAAMTVLATVIAIWDSWHLSP